MRTVVKSKKKVSRKADGKDSLLSNLSKRDIDELTEEVEVRTDIKLISAKQINMRLSPELLGQASKLAAAQGKPVTTFLISLLKEDIARLWSVYKSTG